MIAQLQPPLWITCVVLLTLAVLFAASWWMFFGLANRWTEGRPRFALFDWAKERGFRFARAADAYQDGETNLSLPAPLDLLLNYQIRARVAIASPTLQLIEFRWSPTPQSETDIRGHVLVQSIADDWHATGFRPAEQPTSLIDQFVPTGGATMGGSNERFTVLGQDVSAAQLLLGSSVRALLPPDVGFLLLGHTLMLDFSARPFDPIELDRMLAVAAQVAEHVPRLPAPALT